MEKSGLEQLFELSDLTRLHKHWVDFFSLVGSRGETKSVKHRRRQSSRELCHTHRYQAIHLALAPFPLGTLRTDNKPSHPTPDRLTARPSLLQYHTTHRRTHNATARRPLPTTSYHTTHRHTTPHHKTPHNTWETVRETKWGTNHWPDGGVTSALPLQTVRGPKHGSDI